LFIDTHTHLYMVAKFFFDSHSVSVILTVTHTSVNYRICSHFHNYSILILHRKNLTRVCWCYNIICFFFFSLEKFSIFLHHLHFFWLLSECERWHL